MKRPTVFMFSGQGSQYYHMGMELYQNHARFRLWMDYCDEIVEPLIKTSLVDIIYSTRVGKLDSFDQILYTNPAIICIEYSLARVLIEMNVQPDYLLGYSLGEITASILSGIISLEEGLKWAVDYAVLLEQQTPPARMLAIIDSPNIVTESPQLFRNCWITGRNFQSNFVVSGLPEAIDKLAHSLSQKNISSVVLPVKFGFHTPLMDPIEEAFKDLFRDVEFNDPRIPVISAVNGGKIEAQNERSLWQLSRFPVEFEKTVTAMLNREDFIFIDVGPSGTLATFVRYLLPSGSKSSHHEIINQFGRDLKSFEKLRACLT